MKRSWMGAGALMLSLSVSVPAQDESGQDPIDIQAVLNQAAEGAWVLEGEIDERKADAGGFGGLMVIGGAPGGGQPFEGKIEVWHTEKGEVVVSSRSRLPGFVMYDDGREFLTERVEGSRVVDLTNAVADLPLLLDLAGVSKAVGKVDDFAVESDDDNRPVVTFNLPGSFLPSDDGPASIAMPKVMRVEVTMTVNLDASLHSIEYAVVRSDPMAAFRRQAMQGILGGGDIDTGGSVEITLGPEDLQSDELEEGTTHLYRFQASAAQPTERIQVAAARLRNIALAKRDF